MEDEDFEVILRGEDGEVFTRTCNAHDVDGVHREAERMFPEATVLYVYKPSQRRQDALDRQQALYDNDTWDLY